MRIDCPFCGERGLEEFTYRGDATRVRPRNPDSGTASWVDYVYLRENPAEMHREYWYHALGCQAWLIVVRDLRTHAIASAELAMNSAPVASGFRS